MHTEKQEEDSTTQVKTFEDKPTKKISKPKKEKVTKREIKSPNKRKQSTKGSIASPRQTRKKTSSVKPKRSKGRRVSKATTSSKGTYKTRSKGEDDNTKERYSSIFSTWCVIA